MILYFIGFYLVNDMSLSYLQSSSDEEENKGKKRKFPFVTYLHHV